MIDPNSAKRYRLEKRMWYAQMVMAAALFSLTPGIWRTFSVLYLVEVSIYALALTADGNENSAQARDAAQAK